MAQSVKLSILLVAALAALSNTQRYEVQKTKPINGLVPQDFAYDVNIVHEHSSELYHKIFFESENANVNSQYRFHVSIERGDEVVCSGAIVRAGKIQYVITAASCGVKDTDIVRVKSARVLKSGSVHKIKCVVNHPDFRRPGADPFDKDIAIIFIDGEVTEKPLLVSPPNAQPKEAIETAYTQFSKKAFKNSLTFTEVKIFSRQECEQLGFELTNSMLCAGHFSLDNSFCNVDHGSPIFAKGMLIGVKSWGETCARVTLPAVYTSVAEVYDWIFETFRTQQC